MVSVSREIYEYVKKQHVAKNADSNLSKVHRDKRKSDDDEQEEEDLLYNKKIIAFVFLL